MPRQLVKVRDAAPEDAAALLVLWHELARRGAVEDPVAQARCAIARVAADPDQRIVVLEWECEVVGAVHLQRSLLGPLTDEMVVRASHLQVLTGHRKQGLGHLLFEAAVAWAEEKNVGYVAGVASSSRDTNRFLARLGLPQVAVLRGAPTATLRARLSATAPRGRSAASRNVGQVLASRRSLKRRQSQARDSA